MSKHSDQLESMAMELRELSDSLRNSGSKNEAGIVLNSAVRLAELADDSANANRDLLAAAKAAEGYLNSCSDTHLGAQKVWEQLLAAIARAEGR